MQLKILYDNEASGRLKSGWGFSCLVNEELLFDFGADVETLLFNVNMLNVDLSKIRWVVLSHEHWDHVGGYEILRSLGDVEVYILKSFSNSFKRKLSSFGNVDLRESKRLEKIDDDIFTTGELGFLIKEQSLIVRTSNGVSVITGCSHPGLDKILKVASELGRIHGVIGGFHSFSKLEILRDVELIVPCHCTMRKEEILALYPNSSRRCSAGCVIEV